MNSSGTKEEIEVAKELIHSNIMTEIEIRRKREHKQVYKLCAVRLFY